MLTLLLVLLSGPAQAADTQPAPDTVQGNDESDAQPASSVAQDSKEELQQALNSERIRAGELQVTVTQLRKRLSELSEQQSEQPSQSRASTPPEKEPNIPLIALLSLLLGLLLGLGLGARGRKRP